MPKPVAAISNMSTDQLVFLVIESDISDEIQEVISKYQEVFQEPTKLPPKRACDHQITLMPGAQPVNVRPYWYAPT